MKSNSCSFEYCEQNTPTLKVQQQASPQKNQKVIQISLLEPACKYFLNDIPKHMKVIAIVDITEAGETTAAAQRTGYGDYLLKPLDRILLYASAVSEEKQ